MLLPFLKQKTYFRQKVCFEWSFAKNNCCVFWPENSCLALFTLPKVSTYIKLIGYLANENFLKYQFYWTPKLFKIQITNK